MISTKKLVTYGAIAIAAWWFLGRKGGNGKKGASADAGSTAAPRETSQSATDPLKTAAGQLIQAGADLAKEATGVRGMGETQNLGRVMSSVGAYGGLGGTFYGNGAW